MLTTPITWLSRNWFVLLLPVLILGAWSLVRTAPPADAAMVEIVLLIDVCVSVPLLYALCYARSLPRRRLAVRCLALAGAGIAALRWTLPAEMQTVIRTVAEARGWLLPIILLAELPILILVVRASFSNATTSETLAGKGVPPILAKMMLLEARFWKAVWRLIRRR